MNANVRKNNAKINKFGGINPILFHYKKLGIDGIVSSLFGHRPRQAKYDYDELVRYWLMNQFCGISKIEHVYRTESSFKAIPMLKERTPSHDTIGRMFKDFAIGSTSRKSSYNGKKVEREFNMNWRMNTFLHKVLIATKMLQTDELYTLDVDTVVIPTEVKDAKYTYMKGVSGYNPIVSIINNLPVFVEMRSGNVSPAYEIRNHVRNTIVELRQHGIKVNKVRIDSAGFQRKVVSYLDSIGIKYYIRTRDNGTIRFSKLKERKDWSKVKISITKGNHFKGEVISSEVLFCEYADVSRIVTLRTKMNGGEYMYSSIITNDFESSAKDVIEFYNQRGKEERVFDYLKNDFGWKYPPFSRMSQNTVYFVMSCISYVFYKYIITNFSKRTNKLKSTFRLQKFIDTFIKVIAITPFDKISDVIYQSDWFDVQNFLF